MNEILEQLEVRILDRFAADSSGHDVHHLRRVQRLALRIQEREGGERLVIAAAAILHDVHRIMQHERGRYVSPAESLPTIRAILDATDFPADKIPRVLHCVEFHEEYGFSDGGVTAEDIETLILQDADNLDAIGAIGIARTFAYAGVYGVPMYEPDIPLGRETYDESDPPDPSTIHHFYSKLFKLKDNMHTQTAKEIAAGRHRFMERFVALFLEEWGTSSTEGSMKDRIP
ncbi:MAG: HD domain-containing protein [Rubricoccaceae bacterium]|nr:HD domain-containing protein [Rubricoccaceae bacterium]